MDAGDKKATTLEASWTRPLRRTDLYAAESGTLMTLPQYIAIVKAAGGKFTPSSRRRWSPCPMTA